nr:hypothetical protein Itr_chr12CG18110 [Ipomoea trifida]
MGLTFGKSTKDIAIGCHVILGAWGRRALGSWLVSEQLVVADHCHGVPLLLCPFSLESGGYRRCLQVKERYVIGLLRSKRGLQRTSRSIDQTNLNGPLE